MMTTMKDALKAWSWNDVTEMEKELTKDKENKRKEIVNDNVKNDEIVNDVTALHRRRQSPELYGLLLINHKLLEEITQRIQSYGYNALATELKIIKTQISELTALFPCD